MNPLPLFLIIVTLPLLLGGCGGKDEVTAETKPKTEGVNENEVEYREGIYHLKGSDTPYTGKFYGLYENGQKSVEVNFKGGKQNGLQLKWHENGQKFYEANFKNGEFVEGSEKYWNSKGEPVDSQKEALKE